MRSTTQALLCSLLSACAPIGPDGGGRDYDGPDAGVGSASATCDQYETKTGDITIAGSPSSSSFNNLPSKCWKLNGKLTLSGSLVTSIAGLGDLREVKDLVIDDTDLTKFDSKSPIEVTGDITIRYNDKLTDIANVVPKTGTRSITLEYNTVLTGTGALSKTTDVAGPTIIRGNNALKAIDLGRATRLSGGLTISDNNELTTIDLHSLTSVGDAVIGHDFVFRNNAKLTSLSSLAALEFIHGNLIIDNNDALTTLEGTMMPGTDYASRKVVIDYNVYVSGNAQLRDTGGIAHARSIGGSLTFTLNSQLPYCKIRDVDCCVQTSGNATWSIASNATTSCSQTGTSWCYAQFGSCPN